MNYKLTSETKEDKGKVIRTYHNDRTGTDIKTELVYTDKDGQKWFGFIDLFNIPIMRISMAKHITDLYGMGLTSRDVLTWCKEEKALLNSTDPERNQKLYALILEKEKIVQFTANPLKQSLALCTVYVLGEDERIDYFDEPEAEKKLKLWEGNADMVAFFLSWHNGRIQDYTQALKKISKTVLSLQEKERLLNKQLRK